MQVLVPRGAGTVSLDRKAKGGGRGGRRANDSYLHAVPAGNLPFFGGRAEKSQR